MIFWDILGMFRGCLGGIFLNVLGGFWEGGAGGGGFFSIKGLRALPSGKV